MPSFDAVSKVDVQELDNAVNQARKEITTRYDFQGTHTELTLAEDRTTVLLKSSTEDRVQVTYEVLLNKLAKRGVSLRSITRGPMDSAALGTVKQTISIQQGITVEKSKELIKLLKDSKLKVQGSIQGDQLRVSGKNKDDLQKAISLMRQKQDGLEVELQFTNFRD
jgi:uncharacterized protein YajQ (UPF0234 family)